MEFLIKQLRHSVNISFSDERQFGGVFAEETASDCGRNGARDIQNVCVHGQGICFNVVVDNDFVVGVIVGVIIALAVGVFIAVIVLVGIFFVIFCNLII